jgi:hypothetical protein
MTAKIVVFSLVGAGLVGGAAGAVSGLGLAPKAEPPAHTDAEILDRLQRTEDALTKTTAALQEMQKSNALLQERLTSTEIKAARDAAQAAAAGNDPAKPRARRFGSTLTSAGGAAPAGAGADTVEVGPQGFGGFKIDDLPDGVGQGIAVELGKALGELGKDGGDVPVQLTAFRDALALRNLPEDQRWQKAKDDLNLSWNQIEEMKKAVSDRDAAMKDAMTVEKKTGPNGGNLTISRPDAGKMAHAQADYHDRVAKTLDENQKKSWESKGYDSAFGNSPFAMGGTMAIAIDVQSDKSSAGDAPKDATK